MNSSLIAQQGFRSLFANAFRIYRRNAVSLMAIAAAVLVPGYFFVDALDHFAPDNAALGAFNELLILFLQLTVELLLVGEVSQACFGQPMSARRSWRRASGRGLLRLVGTTALWIGLVMFAVIALMAGGFFLSELTNLEWIPFVGAGAAVIAGAALCVRYIFVSQVVILERVYWTSALHGSASLVAGSYWKTVGYGLLFGASVLVPSILVGTSGLLLISEDHPAYWLVESFLTNAILGLFYVPLSATFWTLFYYSRRIESDRLTTQDLIEIHSFGHL